MARADRFGTLDLLLVFLCLNLASAARFAFLAGHADWGRAACVLLVEDVSPPEFPELVKNWKDDGAFRSRAPLANGVETTAHAAPGYSWAVAKLTEFLPAPVERNVRFLQAELGALAAMLYYLIAFRAFGNRAAAVLAGLFCSLHPVWLVQPAQIGDGPVVAFLLALALWLAGRTAADGGIFNALVLGLSLAGLALTRAELLPCAVGIFLWTAVKCGKHPQGWVLTLLALVGFAGGIGPWVWRNYNELGSPLGVADSAPYHVALGVGPHATGGPRSDEALLSDLAEARTETESKPQLASRLASMAQGDRYVEVGRIAANSVPANWQNWFNQRMTAALGFFLGDEWLRDRSFWRWLPGANDQRLADVGPPLLTAATILMLAFAFFGWRWSFRRGGAVPVGLTVFLVVLPTVLSHSDVLPGSRLPLDGLLLSLAGYAVACLLPRVGPLASQGVKPPSAFPGPPRR